MFEDPLHYWHPDGANDTAAERLNVETGGGRWAKRHNLLGRRPLFLKWQQKLIIVHRSVFVTADDVNFLNVLDHVQ